MQTGASSLPRTRLGNRLVEGREVFEEAETGSLGFLWVKLDPEYVVTVYDGGEGVAVRCGGEDVSVLGGDGMIRVHEIDVRRLPKAL